MCIIIHVLISIKKINSIRIIMHTDKNMTNKRLDITLHPEDIEKLDKIRKVRGYKRSTMIAKLIQEYEQKKK